MKKSKWLVCAAVGAGMLFFSSCRTCGCPMAEEEEIPREHLGVSSSVSRSGFLFFRIAAQEAILII